MQYGLLRIVRTFYLPSKTLGLLTALNLPPLVTLELPWTNNEENISCIPEGRYECSLEKHRVHGDIVRVHDVAGRSGILIHAGNYAKDSTGCILVGKKVAAMQEPQQDTFITHSKEAMQVLVSYVKLYCGAEFSLVIGEAKWPILPEKTE